uniref:Transthyretin-like family protein n=1 Tax=Strongyloides papillosus TaxID=174720 RepID=A0A0N5B9V5_STREA
MLSKSLIAIIFFVLIGTIYSAGIIGILQSTGAKGKLTCKGKPASGVLVKLYDEDDTDFDDLIDKGYTDANGEFFLQGSHKELTPIDPKINIYHKCNDWWFIPFCKKKFTIKIPNDYITQGDNPKNIYAAGTLELSGDFPGQSRDCFH